jgi:hypothetical protein
MYLAMQGRSAVNIQPIHRKFAVNNENNHRIVIEEKKVNHRRTLL